jgi:hypothetical protein
MPPPVPPSVKDGRMTQGSPTVSSAACASAMEWAMALRGLSMPILDIASRNLSRSSALSMTSAFAPISSQPYFVSTPAASSFSAVFSAVCPPMVGSSASGRSFAMIFSTISGVIGSM